MSEPLLQLAEKAIDRARRQGADSADALIVASAATEVSVRDGDAESIERSEATELGLRVFVGQGQAVVSASRLREDDLEELAARAVAMARAAPPDPFAGLAEDADLSSDRPGLGLADDADPDAAVLLGLALAAESAGLSVEGVSKSSGAGASASRRAIGLVSSRGFSGLYARTGYGVSASMIAGVGASMERDYDFSQAVHFAALDDASRIGRSAGERAVKRLAPRKVGSQRVPVLFDRRVAAGLLGHLAGAVAGSAIARGTSFLLDRLGGPVFAPGITIIDDARRQSAPGSRPFDGEGVATRRTTLVDEGRLATWLLDCRSARQLGLRSTGHASRSPGGVPSPASSNLYMEPGARSRDDLVGAVGRGLLVTELMGMGVNGVTGDYSRGATGFWIENGEIAWPVSEITIAGNLKDMYRSLEAASDLEFRTAVNAPTVLVGEMTVAGV